MCNRYPAGIFTANAKGPLWMRSNFHKRRVNGNDQGIQVEMLEYKAQNLLVMTRRFLLTAFVITAIALFANTAQAATFTEDFEADFPTWESNWLGLNSDLNNYYCGGARGCERRDNNPDGLWAYGQSSITVNFVGSFAASLVSLSLDVAGYVNTNLLAYDISDNLIFNSAVLLTGGATSDPGIYSNYTITSSNGISRFVFDSAIARGNTSIDNVIAVTSVAAPVPEPEIYAMLGAGLGLMGWVARRRKQRTV
jgi:hypothetical protein